MSLQRLDVIRALVLITFDVQIAGQQQRFSLRLGELARRGRVGDEQIQVQRQFRRRLRRWDSRVAVGNDRAGGRQLRTNDRGSLLNGNHSRRRRCDPALHDGALTVGLPLL